MAYQHRASASVWFGLSPFCSYQAARPRVLGEQLLHHLAHLRPRFEILQRDRQVHPPMREVDAVGERVGVRRVVFARERESLDECICGVAALFVERLFERALDARFRFVRDHQCGNRELGITAMICSRDMTPRSSTA